MRDIIIKLSEKCMLKCPYCFSDTNSERKMSEDNRTEIIKICNDQKIPSICVLPAPSVFSMEECPSKMNNPNCTYKKLVD